MPETWSLHVFSGSNRWQGLLVIPAVLVPPIVLLLMAEIAEQQKLIKDMDPDFAGLLQAEDASLQVQASLAKLLVCSTSRFSALAGTRAELRKFCSDTLGLCKKYATAFSLFGFSDFCRFKTCRYWLGSISACPGLT